MILRNTKVLQAQRGMLVHPTHQCSNQHHANRRLRRQCPECLQCQNMEIPLVRYLSQLQTQQMRYQHRKRQAQSKPWTHRVLSQHRANRLLSHLRARQEPKRHLLSKSLGQSWT